MLALFRLIDVMAGQILLDGVDTARIGLDALRRQLAIIPQVECLSTLHILMASAVLRYFLIARRH